MSRKRDKDEPLLNMKFLRIILILLSFFLLFAGPTYIAYALVRFLKVGYYVSMSSGFILFLAGLILLWFLTKKKIIRG